jgi:HAE1 family hydrophobic/amphiphilic exporter-1
MGLSVDQVSQTLRAKLRGDVATRLNEGERQIDIVVRAHEHSRARTEQVPELIVFGSEDRPVPLKAVAETELAVGPSEIRRVGQRRAVVISGNLEGRDLGSVTRDIEQAIAGLDLPSTISTRFGGQHSEMESSFGSLYLAIFLAVFLVYFVMASKFESLMHPFIIMFTIPLGLVGVIWALMASGNPVSVIVLIGVVMLAGIVVKNAIVMVDYINICRERGMPKNDAIVEAGKIRLRPILMTTLTTILGLVPMALGLGEGAEIRAPMAITVIGGLAVSTLLTLIVIPTVYSVFDRKTYAGDGL